MIICSNAPRSLPTPLSPRLSAQFTFNHRRHSTPFPIWTPTSTAQRLVHLRQRPLMAKPRRVKMVPKQIQREFSQYAIVPETALGADRYLSSLNIIRYVEVSSDLQVVKVYVTFMELIEEKSLRLLG